MAPSWPFIPSMILDNYRSPRYVMPAANGCACKSISRVYTIWVRAWQAQVGRLKLYLLDLNDPENPPIVRGITNELYGGGLEMRINQELLLGIGGWRLCGRWGSNPEVCHLNEGHAAFAILERALDFMRNRRGNLSRWRSR